MKDELYYQVTWRGRLEVRLWLLKHRLQYDLPEKFWRGLAFKLPRKLVLWALVRVASGTLQKDHPYELTYRVMHQRWERGEGR